MKKVISLLLAVMMVMSMVAISGVVSASAESASSGKILNIISPYGEKNAEDIKLAAVSSKVNASVIPVNEDGIPVEQAYFAETTATKIAKDGMIIDVGEIDFGSVMTEFLAGTVYVDMYVYIENPSAFGTPIFRMFERYSNQNTATGVFDNYLEWNLCNNGVAASSLVAGWNHLTYAIKPTANGNSYIDSAMAEFTAQQKLRYVAFYDHKAEVTSNYAIGAVRLLTNQADKDLPWDLEVSPKDSHVTVGEDLTAADLGVTLNGAAVDAAVTGFDANTAGKQTVTVTYGDYSVKTQINVQAKGFATFQSQSDGLSVSGAGYNVDNFKVGSASVQYASTATPLAQKVFSTPLDFSGLDYIDINMYLTQSAVDNAGSGYWINFEFGSNGNCSNKCVRWRYQGSSSTVAPSKTLKAGWNKVQIPVAALSLDYVLNGTATSNNVPVNGIQWCMAGHDTATNTSHWVDWSAVNWIRVYMQGMTSGSVILVSGIGYGMDTQLNGEYNGDDLAATIADAKDGDTVTIQDNITLDSPVVIDKDITLNLNRYNISGDLSYLFYVNGGSLNIVDNNTYLNISMGGKQTVFGKLVNGKELGAIVRVMGSADPEAVDYSTLSVAKGITLKAVYGVQVLGPKNAAGNEMYAYGVKADLAFTFANPDDGVTEYDATAVYVQGLIKHENGPVINITDGYYPDCNLKDDGDDGYSFALSGRAIVEVSGGKFDGENVFGYAMGPNSSTYSKAIVTVTGGSFASDISEYLAEGKDVDLINGYYVVSDLKNTIDDAEAAIEFSGNWATVANLKKANGTSLIRASKSGSTATFTVTGTYVGIVGYTSPNYGQISVSIDGAEADVVDLYSAVSAYNTLVFGKTVGEGTHKVVVTVLNTKNEAAGAKGVYYAAIDAIKTDGTIEAISDKTFADINVTVESTPVDITVPDVFTSEGKIALEATAVLGTVSCSGNTITYTAPETPAVSDTITYTINGYSGTVNVSFDKLTVEAEDVITGWSTFNSWYLSGHKAAYTTAAGKEANFTFVGDSVSIIGYQSKTYGSFDLYIDGIYETTISEYVESGYSYKVNLGTFSGLGEKEHTITIVTNGKTLIDSFVVA